MIRQFSRSWALLGMFAVGLLAASAPAAAALLNWTGGGTGDWDTTTVNWDNGGTPATWTNGADTAKFSGTPVVTLTEDINANGIVVVNGSDDVTIDGAYTLTLNGSAGTDLDGVIGTGQGQTLRIQTDLLIQGSQNWSFSNRSGLTVYSGNISDGAADVTVLLGGGTGRIHRFEGDNSDWSGGIDMAPGVATIQVASDNNALGTGNIDLDNESLVLQAYGADRVIGNSFTSDFAGGQQKELRITGSQKLTVNGTLQWAGGNFKIMTVDTGATAEFTNVISSGGNNGLRKLGGGLLVFSGDNTYSSMPTQVENGTLIVNGTTAGQSDYTVGGAGNDATLGGEGTIGLAADQTVTVGADGTLAPGNSIGQLNVVGDVVFADGSTFAVEIDALGNSDILAIDGDLDLQAGSALTVTGPAAAPFYVIATYTGTLTGTFDSPVLPAGYSLDYGDGTDSQVTLVPEPGTLALLGLGGLGALLRRRR